MGDGDRARLAFVAHCFVALKRAFPSFRFLLFSGVVHD